MARKRMNVPTPVLHAVATPDGAAPVTPTHPFTITLSPGTKVKLTISTYAKKSKTQHTWVKKAGEWVDSFVTDKVLWMQKFIYAYELTRPTVVVLNGNVYSACSSADKEDAFIGYRIEYQV